MSFIYLSVSIILFVTSKRFFDGVTFGFRRFLSMLPKNKDLLDEWKEKPLPSEKISPSFLRFIFIQASLCTLLTLILLIIYYL